MMSEKTTRVRWLLVFWLFLLSAVAFLDRVKVSIAGISIATEYGISNKQLGGVFSSILWGYALFQTVGGRLADRYGPRRVLTLGVVWWGIFTALTASLPVHFRWALWALITVRFLLGAGEAVVYPASNQFVARWIPVAERGAANGWIFAGVGVGSGLTPPLITLIMSHYGWRASFWVCALIGLLAGAVWFVIARDTPAQHPRVSAQERGWIESGISLESASPARAATSGSVPPATRKLIPWRRVLTSKDVLAVTLSYFCFGYVAWIFFSWFYIYLAQVRRLNLKASAFYAMLPFLAMAVACLLGGLISDWLTRECGRRVGRCGVATVAMALAAAFIALGSHVQGGRLASVFLAGGAGALYLAQSSFWSVTADIAAASSGSVSGFMNMGAQIGGALTALLTPVIAQDFGWTASFLVAAALSLLGSTAWLAVDPACTLDAHAN